MKLRCSCEAGSNWGWFYIGVETFLTKNSNECFVITQKGFVSFQKDIVQTALCAILCPLLRFYNNQIARSVAISNPFSGSGPNSCPTPIR